MYGIEKIAYWYAFEISEGGRQQVRSLCGGNLSQELQVGIYSSGEESDDKSIARPRICRHLRFKSATTLDRCAPRKAGERSALYQAKE